VHNEEEATHAQLAGPPAIADHGGRIVKNTGDGFLAEFPSAVEAVRAAMQFQNRIKELTIGEAEERRIAFRVGVNIGDVIVESHTSRHDLRASQNPEGSASRHLPTTKFRARSGLSSQIWASRRSRTYLGPFAFSH
jgi:class 3 adenylate cyclase